MKINKRLQTIALGIGIAGIIIGIGAVYWQVLFPYNAEKAEIAKEVREMQRIRAKYNCNKK